MILRPASKDEVEKLEAQRRRAESLAKLIEQEISNQPENQPENRKPLPNVSGRKKPYMDLIAEPKYR